MSASFQINALGARLARSGAPQLWLATVGGGETLAGSAGADMFYSDDAGSRLAGGGGNDTYHLYVADIAVSESAGGGIDTLVSYLPNATLPAQVENLIVILDGALGVGNGWANILEGQAGTQFLDGGAGADVLIGGAGADCFILRRGTGRDLVEDFSPGEDVLRLETGFAAVRSHAELLARLTASGADAVLDLGGGDAVVLRGVAPSRLGPGDLRLALDRSQLRSSFAEEFNRLSASPSGFADGQASWRTTYFWGDRTLPANREAEYYVDASLGLNPFSLQDGVLSITAAPAAPGSLPNGLSWTSGLLTSEKLHSQLYGYFEIRAQVPAGQGFWPAFWLLPSHGGWPPELDVMEVLGNDPTRLIVSVHSGAGGGGGGAIPVPDASAGFHSYGVSWRPDMIRWYFDGAEVHAIATPADMHQPMYMLLNLAVGGDGSWPGVPATTAAASFHLDHVRAWQFADLMAAPAASGSFTVADATRSWRADSLPAAQAALLDTTTFTLDGLAHARIENQGAWADALRTLVIGNGDGDPSLAGRLLVANFVEVRLDLAAAGMAAAADLIMVGAKRGSVTTGVGADQILWVAHSNGGTAAELTSILTGGGNDRVVLTAVGLGTLDDRLLADNPAAGGNGAMWNAGYDGAFSQFSLRLGGGADTLLATGGGRVTVEGGAGADRLFAGSGADRLDGGAGADWLEGGGGADTFVLRAGESWTDRIADFQGAGAASGDVIEAIGFGAGARLVAPSPGSYQILDAEGTPLGGFRAVAGLLAGSDLLFL